MQHTVIEFLMFSTYSAPIVDASLHQWGLEAKRVGEFEGIKVGIMEGIETFFVTRRSSAFNAVFE